MPRVQKPQMPQHQSAEKAQDGMTVCGAKCHILSLPVVVALRVALISMTLQPGESEDSFPYVLLQYARAAHCQGDAQTVHAEFSHCKPNPNPWRSLLGPATSRLRSLDRQPDKGKLPAKASQNSGGEEVEKQA